MYGLSIYRRTAKKSPEIKLVHTRDGHVKKALGTLGLMVMRQMPRRAPGIQEAETNLMKRGKHPILILDEAST